MPSRKKREENQCSICWCVKSPDDFYTITKRGKRKKSERCKECAKKVNAADRIKRLDAIKQRAVENRDQIAAYQKQYRQKNAERLKEFYRQRYLKRKAQKPPRVFFTEEEKKARRRKTLSSPSNKIKRFIRHRLFVGLRDFGGGKKTRSSLDYIGCTIEELRAHLESQFTKGMTWENHCRTGWHIDHILPCSMFDHTDEKQVLQCWHYTNLRPMWAKDNLKKGAKVTNPQMRLLL